MAVDTCRLHTFYFSRSQNKIRSGKQVVSFLSYLSPHFSTKHFTLSPKYITLYFYFSGLEGLNGWACGVADLIMQKQGFSLILPTKLKPLDYY